MWLARGVLGEFAGALAISGRASAGEAGMPSAFSTAGVLRTQRGHRVRVFFPPAVAFF
jgi:hypothetical protein